MDDGASCSVALVQALRVEVKVLEVSRSSVQDESDLEMKDIYCCCVESNDREEYLLFDTIA